MKSIGNLQAWGLTERELSRLANQAVVRFTLAYPDSQTVLAYPPAERRRQISARLRAKYQALKAALPPGPFEKLGSHHRPAGMRRRLPVEQLPALLALAAVEGIWVEEIEGLAPRASATEPKCWSIKARFAVQIEHATTGRQLVEERILLIAARNEEEARQKLRPTFVRYAEPYLNSDGQLVRWQFEAFLDAYEVEAGPLAGLLAAEGLEVFSETKSRRLKSEFAWLPAQAASPG
ncbi:DUF4288 domain-containing protein [Hymenobacter cheonanensis]|uniref:DUF4288 domain-containing protein n=1 Tax=Hymenobacter sp. CA2-7 TaxID=3063993 RepID=UPI002713187B|nr:DUF4288 domain-containing protein [Hymenobacter sp. CA2-7]MDO7886343.1 DUF4288 domain-containing protein [Hymenobacter sp. CA2-7]